MVKKFEWYKSDDEKPHFQRRKKTIRKAKKCRKALTPGTICIILSGRFKGKRVIFLKQLKESGLALVTGPYKLNGVPLRRISQSYLLVTQTKVNVNENSFTEIDDSLFKKPKLTKESKDKKFFDETGKRIVELNPKRKELQKKVDEDIIKGVNADKMMKAYLEARFTLRNNMKPHEMIF